MAKTRTAVPWCRVDVDSLPVEVVRGPRKTKRRVVGTFDPQTLRIWIDDSISLEHAESVLIHEVLHALLYARGIALEGDLEEKLVNPVAAALYDVLRRNGWLTLPPCPKGRR